MSAVFVIPGHLAQRSGGYLYDAQIVRGLRQLGWQLDICQLPGDFPEPSDTSLVISAERLRTIPENTLTVFDGLALGAFPKHFATLVRRLRSVALVHHPLAMETGLAAKQRDQLIASEQTALTWVQQVIVTSELTAKTLMSAPYAVNPRHIAVVRPGTEHPRWYRPGHYSGTRLLCVGSLIPRKAHDVLFEALAPLRGLDWTLRCVGRRSADRAWTMHLRRMLRRLRLTERVELCGELNTAQVQRELQHASWFVNASRYEGYGMALAEALAHGCPIVTSTGGAIAETVPEAAAIRVPVDDRKALQKALHRAIGNRYWQRKKSRGARQLGRNLPRWSRSCADFAACLSNPKASETTANQVPLHR